MHGGDAVTDAKKPSVVQGVVALAVFGATAWFFWAGGLERKVADDMIANYNTAKATGDAMQTCVHAGMVVAAYIQANDAANAKVWQATERSDCERAGAPRP